MDNSTFTSSTMLCGSLITPHATARACTAVATISDGNTSLQAPKKEISTIFSPRGSPMVTSYQENGTRMRRKTGSPRNESNEVMVGEAFPSTEDKISQSRVSDLNEPPSGSKPSDFTFFAGNSTLHGINHIFVDGRWTLRRLLWGAAFFTSLGLFLLQGYDRYAYYVSKPHVTKLDELEAKIMDFPAITICNMNSFRFSQVTTDDFYYVGRQIFELFDDDYNLRDGYRDDKTWGTVLKKIQPILSQKNDFQPSKKDFNMFEFYNRTGHALEATILQCRYQGINCARLKDWHVVFTRYGKCYTFNSGVQYSPLTTLKGGIDNGLELLLDTQQNEYMPVWDENDEISVEAGFKVQIHVQGEPPFIHELGFGVSPGFQTLVATQEQRITFLPAPYGECVEEFDRKKHFHFNDYSISACRITCETNFVLDNCSCRMIHMPGNATFCDPEQYKICADKALDYLMAKDMKICVCKTPCLVTRYNLETSTLRLPSTQAASYLAYKYNVSETYVRDNFVKLNVFFEALNYETIEQKVAYEVAALLGDIGGQMGLFIGASILTILELFDYVYEFIKDKTWGRNLRRARREAEQQASIAATTSLLVEKSEKDVSNIMSPSAQYHAVPGTIAMTFPQQRPNHFNGIGATPPRHGIPVYSTQPHQYINQSRSMPYSGTMPYKSSLNYSANQNSQRGSRYAAEEPMPPPPPQYLGQSMMTLRGDCGVPEMALTKRYNGRVMGDGRARETSLSYNDLLHLAEHDPNITEDDDDGDYHPRHGNHVSQLAAYTAGLATLPHFRGGFDSVSTAVAMDDYPPSFHQVDRQRHAYSHNFDHSRSPTKVDYSKTLETDIH
ncbi:acid-sensing ion channel 2-like isoform X2 [Styela clava]